MPDVLVIHFQILHFSISYFRFWKLHTHTLIWDSLFSSFTRFISTFTKVISIAILKLKYFSWPVNLSLLYILTTEHRILPSRIHDSFLLSMGSRGPRCHQWSLLRHFFLTNLYLIQRIANIFIRTRLLHDRKSWWTDLSGCTTAITVSVCHW